MDYVKPIRKISVGRRIILSWLIVGVLCFGIGFCVGWIAHPSSSVEYELEVNENDTQPR